MTKSSISLASLALILASGINNVSAFAPQQYTPPASTTTTSVVVKPGPFGILRQPTSPFANNNMNCCGVDLALNLASESTEEKVASSDAAKSVGKAPKLIIAGAPASGKGTQCELIKEKYGVVHLSTGDMLRAAVAAQTEVGKMAKDYMDSGKLVPDEVIIGVVKDRLNESDCTQNGWLLDGFPRTPAQATALSSAGITADCFIFLNVPDEVLVERVVGRRTDPVTGKIYHMKFSPPEDEEVLGRLEQRSDDTEEKVKVRLEQFHANVEAVKGSYEEISVEVDGTKKPDEVSETIIKAIDAVLAK